MTAPANLSTTAHKRRRRTAQQVETLAEQIYDVLADDHPQSVRHVFYRMTDPRLEEPVEKSDHGYKQVQNRITQMRRDGVLRYDWISDSTRRGYHVTTFNGKADFIRSMAGHYRANLWQEAKEYVEVWCESRSIAGVIQPLCKELAVSLYPCGGFSSITLAYDAAQQINAATEYGETPANIIYIGDYDPAGVLIDRSLEKELLEHLDSDVELNFVRVAITLDQIEAYDLPTKPRKASDRRARHIKETVEAEAMPARVLRQLLRDAVEAYLPPDALNVAKIAEQSERAGLRVWAEAMETGE